MLTGERRKCYYCAEKFNATVQWQLFCGNVCKERWNRENFDCCFYCGDIATERDHILPVAIRGGPRLFQNQETVRSCRECNSLLGSTKLSSVAERYDWLIRKYEKRYALDKPIPKWDVDELMEMGRNLRTSILEAQLKRERGEHKMVWLQVKKLELAKMLSDDDEEW